MARPPAHSAFPSELGLQGRAISRLITGVSQLRTRVLRMSVELGALRAEDAHQRFAAFVLFCLARARRRAEVPVWRYATFDIELSKDYEPVVDIVQVAQGTRPLRNAVRSMSIAKA
jgi:hypothetical protein